jgi:hypothetical protein
MKKCTNDAESKQGKHPDQSKPILDIYLQRSVFLDSFQPQLFVEAFQRNCVLCLTSSEE